MATEMALKYGDKVRVNAVAPGFFISKQNKALLTNEDGTFTERGQQVINKTPFKRFGKQEEVYGAIHYLLSDASSFVTGTVMADGGFSAFAESNCFWVKTVNAIKTKYYSTSIWPKKRAHPVR